MINRIVTRGLGPSRGLPGRAGLVTQGYGGIKRVIAQAAEQIRIRVGSARHTLEKKLDEIVVYAKLIRVNDKRVFGIEGTVRVLRNQLVKGSIRLAEGIRQRAVRLINIIVSRKR